MLKHLSGVYVSRRAFLSRQHLPDELSHNLNATGRKKVLNCCQFYAILSAQQMSSNRILLCRAKRHLMYSCQQPPGGLEKKISKSWTSNLSPFCPLPHLVIDKRGEEMFLKRREEKRHHCAFKNVCGNCFILVPTKFRVCIHVVIGLH